MSFRTRLNVLIAVLVLLVLISDIVLLLVQAAPRARAENDRMMRFAANVVTSSIATIKEASDPAEQLAKLVEEFREIDHVQIHLEDREGAAPPVLAGKTSPGWLSSRLAGILDPDRPPLRLPVDIDGRSLGTVVITALSEDEVGNVWAAISGFAITSAVLAALTFVAMSLIVDHAFRPVRALEGAMRTMEAGNYQVSVPQEGPREVADACRRLNALAVALQETTAENRALSIKLVRIQDDERRQIARELHDELGPYLFAVRADATALKRKFAKPAPDLARAANLVERILERFDAIQRTNRHVLQRLNPVELVEFGLERALEGLIQNWNTEQPDVLLSLDVAPGLPELDDTVSLTIYRMVQEGLTNSFRHANASRIDVFVGPAPANLARGATWGPAVWVRVRDNGSGMAVGAKPGFGLTSMQQRVTALGGTMSIATPAEGGVLLEAIIPAARV